MKPSYAIFAALLCGPSNAMDGHFVTMQQAFRYVDSFCFGYSDDYEALASVLSRSDEFEYRDGVWQEHVYAHNNAALVIGLTSLPEGIDICTVEFKPLESIEIISDGFRKMVHSLDPNAFQNAKGEFLLMRHLKQYLVFPTMSQELRTATFVAVPQE